CWRGPVQRQIAQADFLHEIQTAAYFGQNVAGDLGFAATAYQTCEECLRFGHRHGGEFGNGFIAPAKGTRYGIQALPVASLAGLCCAFVPGVPVNLFASLRFVEASQLQACAKAARAPAVLEVVREHAWIGL